MPLIFYFFIFCHSIKTHPVIFFFVFLSQGDLDAFAMSTTNQNAGLLCGAFSYVVLQLSSLSTVKFAFMLKKTIDCFFLSIDDSSRLKRPV